MAQSHIEFITVTPFNRIKEGWKIADQNLLELVNQFDPTTSYSNFVDPYDCQQAEPDLYQQAFLHVVTETVFDYPHNAYGEKTFKPVSCLRPFVMLNVPGALQELQDFGFKTFSNWWSEDYDSILDPTARLLAVLDIIKWVCEQDVVKLKNLMLDMQPILEHNHYHYYNKFVPQQIAKFDIACRKNLKPR